MFKLICDRCKKEIIESAQAPDFMMEKPMTNMKHESHGIVEICVIDGTVNREKFWLCGSCVDDFKNKFLTDPDNVVSITNGMIIGKFKDETKMDEDCLEGRDD